MNSTTGEFYDGTVGQRHRYIKRNRGNKTPRRQHKVRAVIHSKNDGAKFYDAVELTSEPKVHLGASNNNVQGAWSQELKSEPAIKQEFFPSRFPKKSIFETRDVKICKQSKIIFKKYERKEL